MNVVPQIQPQRLTDWPDSVKVDPLYVLQPIGTGVYYYVIEKFNPVFTHTYNQMQNIQFACKLQNKRIYLLQKIMSGEELPQLMTQLNNVVLRQDIVKNYDYVSPIDITDYVQSTSVLRFTLQRGKSIRVMVGIYIGTKTDVNILAKSIPVTDSIKGKDKILKSLDSSELETSISIGVNCPISRNRMKIPSRSYDCIHFSCFDLGK